MILRKYSIYKVKHLVEGGELYMIYLGNNQFGLGQACSPSALIILKKELLKKKSFPDYESLWAKPKEFNSYPDTVDVLELVPLKSIKLGFGHTSAFMPAGPVAKPKKDYSKMRVLNHDS